MAAFVGFLVEAEGVLPVGQTWDNGFRAAVRKPVAQFCAVIGLVSEQLSRRLGSADQAFCYGAIMRLAARQEDGKKTAFSICDCVDLRIAPAA
jgi:hypothetical protein